jgi:hypothetical protein
MNGRRAHASLVMALSMTLTAAALADWPPAMPASTQLTLTVRETAGVARAGEVLSSGVPLPRSYAIISTANLAIVDGAGTPVPAEFRVLGRWFADLEDSAASIQWLLVSFPASVAANGAASYRLVVDGSVVNPPPPVPLTLTQVGNQVTVNTGVATFVLGGNPHTLFDEVRSAGGALLAGGGALDATTTATYVHNTLRAVEVVWSGPLTAVVQVRGSYSMPAVGGGGLGAMRRYVFRAGAPAALVRHALAWEGASCPLGEITCGGVNGLLINSSRDLLELQTASPWAVQVVGDREQAALTAPLSEIHTAAVRQLRRVDRLAAPQFEAYLVPPIHTDGDFADGAMMAASTAAGAVAVALRDMHLYEPQSLMLQAGSLEIHLADGGTWLGARQGLFANFAVAALAASPSRATLDRQVWAPLNRPLRAWPGASWWAASQAVEEFPVGTLPLDLASYDTRVPAVLAKTESLVLARGLEGLMTRGLWPRYWGDPLLSDEIGCGNDPTPADDWDDVYWCTVWADYHNTSATAAIWAFRSGQVEWLDRIAAPAAWRMLHTVIQQCAPGDGFFYCGQAPTGYGGYRSDNNGSHAYVDNLLLYYWLTGDETVVDTLQPGARTMRAFMCPGRGSEPPGAMCGPNDLIADPWANLNGRVAVQWYRVFRFLGLASGDGTYLTDWQGNVGRWLTQYWAQPGSGVAARGFTVPSGGGVFDHVDGPGSYGTDQLWMASLYDLDVLERLAVDSLDAPVGSPPLAPSAVEIAWARSLAQIGSATPWSTGTPAGPWPNVVSFTWSGSRVGGTLDALGANHIDADGDNVPCELCDDDGDGNPGTCADICLYDEGKSPLGAALARAGDRASDPALAALGRQFAVFGLDTLGVDPQPLNKKIGIGLSRLHAAVARAALAPFAFADGFESGSTGAWSADFP